MSSINATEHQGVGCTYESFSFLSNCPSLEDIVGKIRGNHHAGLSTGVFYTLTYQPTHHPLDIPNPSHPNPPACYNSLFDKTTERINGAMLHGGG